MAFDETLIRLRAMIVTGEVNIDARPSMFFPAANLVAEPRTPGLASRPQTKLTTKMADRGSASEELLLADVRAIALDQDRTAFRRLFQHYAPRVKAYLKRLGSSDDIAEDLAQEVLLSVWRRAHQFDRSKASLSTWIFTIARNKRIDAIRREKRPDIDLDDPALEPDPAPSGDVTAELREMSQLAVDAMASLPEEQRQLVQIFYFQDKTHSAIADELQLPLGTVKSRLRLALVKLRAVLGAELS